MMTKILYSFFFFCFAAVTAQTKGDDVLGSWLATDKSVAVEVFKKDGNYRAKVLWFDEKLGCGKPLHMRHDTENPDPKLRKRKIIGMEILDGLRYNAQLNSWENGRIYDASSGRYWDSSASLGKDGLLKVRGFWKFKWIGKSMSFRRTNPTILTKL